MRRFWILALIVGVLLVSSGLAALANPLWPGYFELLDRAYTLQAPPNGSVWQSVSSTYDPSNYQVVINQTSYDDNGDGVVSTGDRIVGPTSGMATPIVVVDGVRHLYRLDENGWVLRPLTENGGSPVGETWQIIWPLELWGTELLVEGWSPPAHGGAGEPGDGDLVVLEGTEYVLRDVRLCVEGAYGVPVNHTSWGKIKQFLRNVF